jgi:hypothetical protein
MSGREREACESLATPEAEELAGEIKPTRADRMREVERYLKPPAGRACMDKVD